LICWRFLTPPPSGSAWRLRPLLLRSFHNSLFLLKAGLSQPVCGIFKVTEELLVGCQLPGPVILFVRQPLRIWPVPFLVLSLGRGTGYPLVYPVAPFDIAGCLPTPFFLSLPFISLRFFWEEASAGLGTLRFFFRHVSLNRLPFAFFVIFFPVNLYFFISHGAHSFFNRLGRDVIFLLAHRPA